MTLITGTKIRRNDLGLNEDKHSDEATALVR